MSKLFAYLFLAAFTCLQTGFASAADFPDKSIKIVVPFPAGGAADTLTRVIGVKLSTILGQAVVVQNMPGAATIIGSSNVAKSAPDGYSLLIFSNSFLINAKLQKELPYDGLNAIAPIAVLVNSPQVIAVNASSSYKNFSELLNKSKESGSGLSYSTVGPNTSQNIAGELLKLRTGLAAVYVPFAGGALAGNAVAGGHVTMVLTNWNEITANVQSGKLRPLAVTTKQRIEPLKDTPTLSELGYPEVEVDVWFGVAAPRGTPTAVLDKLSSAFKTAVADPEVQKQLVAAGFTPDYQDRQMIEKKVKTQYEFLSKLIDEMGMKAE